MTEDVSKLPSTADVVIVGGGVVGCSIAYHLTKRGCSNVVLLERKQLTSGTTWHAAGLVGQLRATHNLTRLAQYTTELYTGLERETGQATGFQQIGSLAIATTSERMEELKRGASMARCFGLEVNIVTAAEAQELWPLMQTKDVVGAVYLPRDGQTSPVDTTQALARGARNGGARIFENTKVTAILQQCGKVAGVVANGAEIRAKAVVNCAGMWAREIGKWCGVSIPLYAAEHFYIITEPIDGLQRHPPVLRDPDGCAYFKEDAGKLLVGWFEPVAKPWGSDTIPETAGFDQLPQDLEHIEPLFERAMTRVPALANCGIQLFFNGPESFTPDDRYLLGEAPDLKGFYVAAGFNSIGIQSAGGAGKVLADLIVDGHPPMDLWDVSLARMMPFQQNVKYLRDRTVESLGLLYAMHWPFRQAETARDVRKSALHDRLKARGACFGEVAGWERPNWYAPHGEIAEYQYSYGRQNWFEYSAAEHRAVREAVGLFDQSSFAKYLLVGRDAERILNRICANDVAVAVGKVVYTQWLNERGGIEADLTVTREAEDSYLIITSAATQSHDFAWLRTHISEGAHAVAVDVSPAYAVLGVMGPRSRDLIQMLTPADMSNSAFPFATSKVIDLGYARVRATRITYVGELGWELYVPTEFVQSVYDLLCDCGADFGLRHAGYHAMNSLRIEKAYRSWGHDITDEDTPIEAGLGFAVALGKPGGFIGQDAIRRQKESGVKKRLIVLSLQDPNVLLYHNEPIWRDGELCGRVTSAMFGHTVGAAVGMGYVERSDGGVVDASYVSSGKFEVEVADTRVAATASLRPLYDPSSAKIRI